MVRAGMSPAASRRDISGSSTVPTAIPITPIGKLIDAVGVIERRDRAGGEKARNDGVGEQRKLHAGGADGRRTERAKEFAHIRIEHGLAEARQHVGAPGVAHHQREFENAGDEHAPGGGVARGREEHGERKRRHHRQIEQDRRRGRRREMMDRIQDAAIERDQRHQQQIRKGDAGQFGREREAVRIGVEARRQHRNHLRREHERDGEQHGLHRNHQREDAVGEQLGRVRPVLGADARIGRHEGGVEGALGKDRAEMIGQPQRDEEGVGDRACAQDRGQHDVAREIR